MKRELRHRWVAAVLALVMVFTSVLSYDVGTARAEEAQEATILNLKEVYGQNGKTVTTQGTVAHIYGSAGSGLTSIILEDNIEGEIVGLQIYDSKNTYTVGTVVEVTGAVSLYGGVIQITPTKVEVLGEEELFEPQEVTIAQLEAGGDNYLSEYVMIKDVTLGTYTSGSNTTLTDATGTLNLYKGAPFPAGVVAGDTIHICGVYSKYNTTYQFRNGTSADYISKSGTVNTSVTLPIANWAGVKAGDEASKIGDTYVVYADLNTADDRLSTDAYLSYSTGERLTVNSNKNLGTSGATEGKYYQFSLNSKKLGNITLNYSMKGSNTGPKNFKVLYSTDGTNFVAANDTIYSITAASTFQKFSVTLPSGANNAENLYIRLEVANSISINNGTIQSGGSNYLQEVSITGSPIESPDIVSIPSITPNSGMVALGAEITMTSKTLNAEIHYTYNDGAESIYDKNSKPVFTQLPAKIVVWGVKSGLEESFKATYQYTQNQVVAVKASPNGGARTIGTKVSLTCETEGAVILYSLDHGSTWENYDVDNKITLTSLPMTIKTKATREGFIDSVESTVSFTQRLNEEYNVYFGQIHSHTEYSDGAGTCDQAFDYAKNKAKQIDFLAVTDHSNSFDNADKASIKDGSASAEWKEGHELADQYTDGTFVGAYGYEMTWSNGLGHMNTFNSTGFQSRTQTAYATYGTALQNYYAALKTEPSSFSQFNHPGTTFGDFSDFAYYDSEIDGLITLIEVGNGEGAIGSSGYFPSYEYYTRALDKGWHVAPTNNQDNHKGYWGDANTARTVVLADSLARDNIYEALVNMRTYATEDNDLEIQYTLNGECMGTIMDNRPNDVNIKVSLKDPTDAAAGKVEVIVNGGLSIATETLNTKQGTVNFMLPADYSYYYIRVTQDDNNIAVTAPVWIDEVEAVGISGMSTDEPLPVKDEALDITLDLYNNEKEDLEIESIVFDVAGDNIHTVDLDAAGLKQIPSCGTKSYTFSYTYDKVGAVSINATVRATLRGTEKVYKGILKLTYVDASMITKVLVDGSHANDYVAGYYGGNMGNFTKIAAKENVRVEIINKSLTAEKLAECDLLIISAPAKKAGTANAGAYTLSHFEDSFIELVKEYTEQGGALILCGLADYQDTADGQTSTELNKLLSAIGATTRVNSDEAMDDSKNGGQAYRLYPENFDTSSAFLTGIVAGQKYSQYSGCTILMDDAAVAAGKASALVTGFETTYSIDSKTLGEGYTDIGMGNTVFMGYEKLSSGTDLFVAGGVFMSDFEVKAEVDNIWDVQYANYTIIKNIVSSVKKQMPLTTIADVRNGQWGNIYAVEGTVTAGTKDGNAFFDTIYIQDQTTGINIFPINEGLIEVGQKVRVEGYLDEYLGDLELRVISAKVTNTAKTPLQPTTVKTSEAMDYAANGGRLVKVQGTISDVVMKEGIVETILVKDSSGVDARVFIDGYVRYSTAGASLENFCIVGKEISAIGLVSYDPDGERIRVRDRSEIVLKTADKPSNPSNSTEPKTDSNNNTKNNTNTSTSTTKTDEATKTTITVDTKKDSTGKTVENSATVELGAVNTVKEKNKATVETKVSESLLLEAAKTATAEKPLEVVIKVESNTLLEQIAAKNVKTVAVAVTLPKSVTTSDNIVISGIDLGKEILNASKKAGKDLVIAVMDEEGKEAYSMKFDGKELKDSSNKVTAVNAAVSIGGLSKDKEVMSSLKSHLGKTAANNGIVFDFAHSGVLPATAEVKANVSNMPGIKAGKTVYVYYFGDKLESLANSKAVVAKDGTISFKIKHCSKYVILPSKPNKAIVTTLFDKITVTKSKSIKTGKSGSVIIKLPIDAKGESTMTYKTSNKSIATVSKTGKIIAKKKGNAVISTTVVIDGEKKTYKTKITVK